MKAIYDLLKAVLILLAIVAVIYIVYSATNGNLGDSLVNIWNVVVDWFKKVGAFISNLFTASKGSTTSALIGGF